MAGQYPYSLNQTQFEAFRNDGVVHLPRVIDDEWVIRGREACKHVAAVETVADRRADEYFMKLRVWENHEVFRHFCFDPAITGIAAQLTGSEKLNLLYDQMFNIAPGSGDRTAFHNDLPFWPIQGKQVASIWLAFDRVTRENGALEFIRGSHLWDRQYQAFTDADGEGGQRELFQATSEDGHVAPPDWDAERDKHDLLQFDLEPGDALAFQPLVVHASHPNVSADMQRRAYAMRFTGETVRYYDGPRWNVYVMNPALKSGDLLDSEQYPVVRTA